MRVCACVCVSLLMSTFYASFENIETGIYIEKGCVLFQGLLMSTVNDNATRLYTETVNKMHEDMERSVHFDSRMLSLIECLWHL